MTVIVKEGWGRRRYCISKEARGMGKDDRGNGKGRKG